MARWFVDRLPHQGHPRPSASVDSCLRPSSSAVRIGKSPAAQPIVAGWIQGKCSWPFVAVGTMAISLSPRPWNEGRQVLWSSVPARRRAGFKSSSRTLVRPTRGSAMRLLATLARTY